MIKVLNLRSTASLASREQVDKHASKQASKQASKHSPFRERNRLCNPQKRTQYRHGGKSGKSTRRTGWDHEIICRDETSVLGKGKKKSVGICIMR
jgi:hypothetical protein